MCGSLILLILVVKHILRCFVANSLLSQVLHFLGKSSFCSNLAEVKKIVFFHVCTLKPICAFAHAPKLVYALLCKLNGFV